VVGDDYSKVLSSYRSMLTSTNMFISKSPHAKFFEIIASGSIALTNRFDHSDVLFKNKCWVEFKDDCSDVVDKARWIMNNENECRNMRDEAHREFLEKHTDDIRLQELYDVLKTQLESRELYKKWSI
jgi:spore maturation protein CgeB